MKKFILTSVLVIISVFSAFSQEVSEKKLFTLNFVCGEQIVSRDLFMVKTTKGGSLESDEIISINYKIDKIKLTELKSLDSIFAEGYEITSFNLRREFEAETGRTATNTSFFDKSKLDLLRADYNGASYFIDDLWLNEVSTGKKKLIKNLRIY